MLQSLERKVECLAKNIYFEARGEGRLGQLAVAHVTLNRTKSSNFPDSICEVVYQKSQFSWTVKPYKIVNEDLFERIRDLAKEVLLGKTKDPTKGAVSFHNKNVNPGWNRKQTVVIGNHVFYK